MEQQERSVRVIFLRHAIARHNVMNDRSQPPTTDPSWLDPSLTLPGKLHAIAAGHVIRSWLMENDNASKRRQGSLEKETSPQQHQQQQHLRHPPPLLSGQPFESNNNNRDTHQNLLVVTSPLTRCLQTASLAFLSEDCGAPVESQNNVATAGKDDAARPSTAHTGRTAVAAPATPAPTVICCKEDVREAFGIHYPYQRRAKSILQVPFATISPCLNHCSLYGIVLHCDSG